MYSEMQKRGSTTHSSVATGKKSRSTRHTHWELPSSKLHRHARGIKAPKWRYFRFWWRYLRFWYENFTNGYTSHHIWDLEISLKGCSWNINITLKLHTWTGIWNKSMDLCQSPASKLIHALLPQSLRLISTLMSFTLVGRTTSIRSRNVNHGRRQVASKTKRRVPRLRYWSPLNTVDMWHRKPYDETTGTTTPNSKHYPLRVELIPITGNDHEATGLIENTNRTLRSFYNCLRCGYKRSTGEAIVDKAVYGKIITLDFCHNWTGACILQIPSISMLGMSVIAGWKMLWTQVYKDQKIIDGDAIAISTGWMWVAGSSVGYQSHTILLRSNKQQPYKNQT